MSKNNSLKKMSRKDLIEVLLLQNEQISELENEVNSMKELLNKREIIISEAGSIAEASLKLNDVFETAQKAADQYLESIKKMNKKASFKIKKNVTKYK